MSAYLYVWSKRDLKWCLFDILTTEQQAIDKGRLLWKSGATGIKIDVIQTVVEKRR